MTQAQKDSAIKKINERYIQICREFGPQSGIAKDYANTMELAVGSENLQIISSTTSKRAPKNNPDYITGEIKVVQIKRAKKVLDSIEDDDIEALLNKHTAGDIKRSAKEEAKRQQQETGEDRDIMDIIEDMDAVYDFFEEYGYDSKDDEKVKNVFDTYWGIVGPGGPRTSYSDLRYIIENLQKRDDLLSWGDTEAAQNVENKLFKRLEAKEERNTMFGGL